MFQSGLIHSKSQLMQGTINRNEETVAFAEKENTSPLGISFQLLASEQVTISLLFEMCICLISLIHCRFVFTLKDSFAKKLEVTVHTSPPIPSWRRVAAGMQYLKFFFGQKQITVLSLAYKKQSNQGSDLALYSMDCDILNICTIQRQSKNSNFY